MDKSLKYYFIFIISSLSVLAAQADMRGEASLIMNTGLSSDSMPLVNISTRYIPTIGAYLSQSDGFSIDLEAAGNFTFHKSADGSLPDWGNDWANFHRLWARYTTDRFEARLGLQKITFGQARLFRPLQWFDTINPRDPLKYTTGVSGLRLRYDFPNNAGLWLWGIYSRLNASRVLDQGELPETGGRFVYPLGPGEVGLSYNRAWEGAEEKRFAADGFWDVGVGLWFEMGLTNIELIDAPDWQTQFTLGTDYTFGIGNGLTVTGEYFLVDYSEDILGDENQSNIFGAMGTYPITIMDNLSFFSIYFPDGELFYNYINWQRTYDNWLLQAGFYFSTSYAAAYPAAWRSAPGTKGIQFNLTFNH